MRRARNGEGRRVHVSSSSHLGLVAVVLVATGKKANIHTRSSPPLLIWVSVVLVVAPCVVVCVGGCRGSEERANKGHHAITNDKAESDARQADDFLSSDHPCNSQTTTHATTPLQTGVSSSCARRRGRCNSRRRAAARRASLHPSLSSSSSASQKPDPLPFTPTPHHTGSPRHRAQPSSPWPCPRRTPLPSRTLRARARCRYDESLCVCVAGLPPSEIMHPTRSQHTTQLYRDCLRVADHIASKVSKQSEPPTRLCFLQRSSPPLPLPF